MELIEIVDKNGKFTGEIMDKDEAHDKNLLHNEIAVFVINYKNQVLLQKRSANKRYNPNKWALCAGHVDAYESLEKAALREIKEEIGIDLSSNDLFPFSERKIKISEKNSHITYFYYTISNKKETDFIIQKEELAEVKWVDIDEIFNTINSNDNSTIFNQSHIRILEDLKKIMIFNKK